MAGYTDRERELLNGWPIVTGEDLTRMNDLFPHYLFFRKNGDLMGLGGVKLYASCCGHEEYRPYLTRTETPEHRDLLDHLKHKELWTCPWCGRTVTVINLAKAGKRKSLHRVELTVLLHVQGEALYADALALRKDYADETDLTAHPIAWCSSGYRFVRGEVMQVDHQWDDKHPYITYERDKLGRKKQVSEPFKDGPIYWYHYEPYSILNREILQEHPLFRYCGYFDLWQYRPMGSRGYAARFHDFISYLTAYTIYPRQVEMLAKVGYWEPLDDLIYSRKKNAAAMCWEEPDPRKSFRLNKRELSLLMGMQPPLQTLAVRNYVGRHWGEAWSLPFCMDFCNLWGCRQDPMEVLRFLNRYRLDPDRFLRYLGGEFDRDHIETVCYADLFEIYRDYLNGAYQLGYCLEHSRVLWPPELFTAHDLTMEQLAQRQEVSQAQNRRARRLKYEFELDGWKIVFPATAAAIKREGKMLCHCVGGSADRHMRGVTTILFLRRSSAPGTPYVTIEMDGNQIRQVHGYHNDILPGSLKPREVHKAFLDTWLRWLRAGSKRNKDGTPKLPKRTEKKKQEVGAA